MSKLTPYLVMILFGLLMMRFLLKSKGIKNKAVKVTLALILLVAPFSAYFALNPVYQGDFSQNGKEMKIRNSKTTSMENGLLVLTIPGCPYCFESIGFLKKIQKRNPRLKIQFAVTGTEDKAYLTDYKREVNKVFDVALYTNASTLVKETGGRFPTFILVKNSEAIYAWSNDQFGVRAIDKLENWK
jgi:hypothetical protein